MYYILLCLLMNTGVYKSLSAVKFTGLFNPLNFIVMHDFIFAVQVYDKVAHVTYYQCFFSSLEVAKKHVDFMNSFCKHSRFFKVKKIRLFHSIIDM